MEDIATPYEEGTPDGYHSAQMTRRTFIEESSKAAIAASIASLLAGGCQKKEGEHVRHGHHEVDPEKRRKILKETIDRAAAFRRNPKKWWQAHKPELLLEGDGIYVVECVDEGDDIDVFLKEANHEIPPNFDVISVPGSGSMYTGFGSDLTNIVGKDHLIGVTSHRDCGACKGDDARAKQHAQDLAREVGTEYLGHVEHLQRPEFHVALGSNLRYTPRVRNLRFCADAPRYFDTSQWCISDRETRIKNIELMLKIAYHHGFNELLVEDDGIPYELCIWYDAHDPKFSRKTIAAEVREAYQNADIPEEVKRMPHLLKLTFLDVG